MALICRKRNLSLALGQSYLMVMADKEMEQIAWEGSDISIMRGLEEQTINTVDRALWKQGGQDII